MAEHYGGHRAKVLREIVRQMYGEVCWICRQPIPEGQFSVDHLIPRSLGGTDDPELCRPAHKSCNSRRGNRPITRRRTLETSTEW